MSSGRRPPGWARALAAAAAVVLAVGVVAVGTTRREAPAPAPAQATPEPIEWFGCEPEGFECASVPVPLDPADPEGPRTALFVSRLPANGAPGERVGSLFLNPGGPGGSAIDFLAAIAPAFAPEVRAAFDVVAFNPRGVTPSSPTIECPPPAEEPGWANAFPSGAAQWTDFFESAAAAAATASTACQLSLARTGPYYGTNVVVEDLEWLRRAVGDDGLTYWGVSYGTRIGEVYAQRHPDKVRAMILDGNVDPANTLVTFNSERGGSFDDAFSFFLAQFPAAAPAFDTVAAALADGPMEVLVAGSGEPFTLTYESFLGQVLMGLLSSEAVWPAIAAELVALADQVEGAPTASVVVVPEQRNATTVNTQVNCTDLPGRPGVSTMVSTALAMRAAGPIFGPAVASALAACSGFPLPVDAVPDTSPPGAELAPVLLISSVHDPSTPYVWSERMRDFLPGSVLVTYEGAQHGVWNQASACVNDVANAYVVDLTVPAPGIECPYVAPGGPADASDLDQAFVVP